jgi:hypothetical protein
MRPPLNPRKGNSDRDLRQPTLPSSPILPTDAKSYPADLAAVVAAWPELPEAIRAGIAAMVKAASGR